MLAEYFAVLFEGAEGFGQSLGRGDEYVTSVGPLAFGDGGESRADIAGCISKLEQPLKCERLHRIGEIMPELLERGTGCGIVQHETDVFLHHAQGFPRAIDVGVKDTSDVRIHWLINKTGK